MLVCSRAHLDRLTVRCSFRENLWVAVAPKEEDRLIVGSNPAIRAGGHSISPDTELILALAHDVALSGRCVRYFNWAVFKQSTKVAGRSKRQLEYLCRLV